MTLADFHQVGMPRIEKADTSDERLATFQDEGDHMELAVELLVEAACYVCVGANATGPEGSWSREQAVVGGNMVRLYKLLDAMLDQTVKHRQETSFIMARLIFETIVNLRYLMKEASTELCQSYILHSLDHEKKTLGDIETNVAARGGVVLPVEDRMRKSIDRMLRVSQVQIEEIPARKQRDWGGKNLYERAKSVGLEPAYRHAFANASNQVHGSWGDLYANHLEEVGAGRFSAKMEWGHPRPQLVHTISILACSVVDGFVGFIGGKDAAALFSPQLDDLHDRIGKAMRAHEAYLTPKVWPEI